MHFLIKTGLLFLIPWTLLAQEQRAQDTFIAQDDANFSAVVQYVEGTSRIKGTDTSLDFKSIIKNKDSIEVLPKSYLKIVTQNRCIGVIYGPATITAPENKNSSWIMGNSTFRWICPDDKTENIKISDTEIKVQNGEVLFDKKMFHIFKDTVWSNNSKLDNKKVYGIKKGKLLPYKKQPSQIEIWNSDRALKLPKESLRWVSEKPENTEVSRIFIQPHIGFGGVQDWDDDRDITEQRYNVSGARISANFLVKKKYSIITFFEHSEFENSDARNQHYSISPGYNNIRIKSSILGLGLRHSHTEALSGYYYVGLSKQEVEAVIFEDFHYDISLVYKSNLVLGAGYQYILFPKTWFSLIVGVEGRIIQSLHQGSIRNVSSSFGADPIDPRGHFMNYSMSVYLGPSINF